MGGSPRVIINLRAEVARPKKGSKRWLPSTLGNRYSAEQEVRNYFLGEDNTEYALDVVELFFRIIHHLVNNDYSYDLGTYQSGFDDVVERLNHRFKEHGIGYSFEETSIIRFDSEFIHAELIKPVLKILHGKEFQNAEEEYLKAHEHYRHQRYSEALMECLKSVETTIKIIGNKRGWNIKEGDSIKKLIEHVYTNKLIPDYLQSHFSGLRSCLESGIPTVRNKSGGHGQGITSVETPAYLAGYLLGETATTIRLLVDADRAAKI